MLRALVVDDDKSFTLAVSEYIEQEGFSVVTADSVEEARSLLDRVAPDLLLIDLMLPDGNGLDLVQPSLRNPAPEVVVITGHASLDAAIQSLRAQACDFLTKPIDVSRLQKCLKAVAAERSGAGAAKNTHRGGPRAHTRLVGESNAMHSVRSMIERVAPTDATVFLQGESGTGKDVIAQTIHQRSPRRDNTYLAVNCGAISPQLIGTELFGHEKGSFTGANRQHKGHFERTSGGTLFLDEVTEMPLDLQVQLLRVLETGNLIRIGGDTEIPVDVRLIAATNCDPEQAVAQGKLRQDLYFRLLVFPIQVPPLRQRDDDILLLANYFLAELNHQYGAAKRLNDSAIALIEQHPWPGNVRELRNAVQRAFILAEREIDSAHFPPRFDPTSMLNADGLNLAVGMSIDAAEKHLILTTFERYQRDKPRTAQALGISLKTLYNRLKQYGAE